MKRIKVEQSNMMQQALGPLEWISWTPEQKSMHHPVTFRSSDEAMARQDSTLWNQ